MVEQSAAVQQMTPGELQELAHWMNEQGVGAAQPNEPHNVHTFLRNVSLSKDTTKTGNLSDEEVGLPKLPQRSMKDMALIASHIMGNNFFADYFMQESEIITSTSLSKEGKLLELAVISRRELADVSARENAKKKQTKNKGWFSKKSNRDEGGEE